MRANRAGGSRGDLDELSSYLAALRKYPPLTREEEHALAVRAGRGDASAEHSLVRHNLALVVAIARMQRRGGAVHLDDLVQEGNVGLIRAVAKFNPYAGTRFSTYAAWWIRAHVGKYLKEAPSTVRPRSGSVAQPDVSLDCAAFEDGDATRLESLEDAGVGPEGSYLSAEFDHAVRDAIAKVRHGIGELGWDILHQRLQQDSPRTLEEIGRRWSISRERVRQVEVKTKRLLKRRLESLSREVA